MNKAEVLVKITIDNLFTDEELGGFSSFDDAVRWIIQEEGNFIGLMNDEFEIVSVKRMEK